MSFALSGRALSENKPRRQLWLMTCAVAWFACVAWGLAVVWAYDNRPGVGASAPTRWPAASTLARDSHGPTLIFLAHPQCDCTRASLEELTQILAGAATPPKTFVLFVKPAGMSDSWMHSGLWERAASLRNATVVPDDGGVEARRFGVETSGQALLYDRAGTLIFSGGITGSRGHAGANAGEAALTDLLARGTADRHNSNVFGCALF